MSELDIESRAKLAQDVYNQAKDYFESFNGEIGCQMTYLLGAIINDNFVEFDCSFSEQVEVVGHLQKCFNFSHPVWNYIHLEF
jgi:hypothetical protein